MQRARLDVPQTLPLGFMAGASAVPLRVNCG